MFAERIAWAFGIAAIAVCGAASLAGTVGARHDLSRFDSLRAAESERPQSLPQTASPDLSLWNPGRVRAWRAALLPPAPTPIAILRIPRIRLEVAVLPGTDDFVLNRGVGHIEDTALPGADSNTGIAGHRDGFFRGLKDIVGGDAIEIQTLDRRQAYRVERTWIADPGDVSALEPTPVRSLTLVTCYPFYFVGSAPQRFIVRAVQDDAEVAVARR